MGILFSPDIFQENISDVMQNLVFVRTYLDDLLVISTSAFEDHIQKLEIVLKKLSDTDIDYLRYWITNTVIQPIPNKIITIKNMACPTTRKELRRFIGMVNYYQYMWCRHSDLLAQLAALTSKNVKFDWTDGHQHAFENAKKIICGKSC
jgi:hypothetical protein